MVDTVNENMKASEENKLDEGELIAQVSDLFLPPSSEVLIFVSSRIDVVSRFDSFSTLPE